MKLALTPIVMQLRACGFRQVEGVLEVPREDEQPRSLPALFVIPSSETASPNATAGRRDQKVEVAFSVIVVVDGARRNRDGVSEEIKSQFDMVQDAITGWTHPEASGACDYSGSRMASAGRSTVTFELRFKTRYHLRKD